MINERVNLKDYYPMLNDDSYILESYCPSNYSEIEINRKRKTIVILPGGAYAYCSDREAEPVALKLLAENINVFVLKYKIAPFKYPHPLIGVYAALAYIRKNADKYNVDSNKIGVMGFSAGGHLAASVSCYYDEDYYANFLHEDKSNLVVNGCFLGYPVILMDEFTHKETKESITQKDAKLTDYFSIEKHVKNNFPKTFIWHTRFDNAVSVLNSINLAKSLTEKGVLYEMHIYPYGDHGQSVADDCVYGINNKEYIDNIQYNKQWVNDAIHFIKEYM